ncbi:MAG: co-chaperone HscB [Litorilituus sp.]|nr:co-chaperone HscB [Litorilituus sp.]
MNYFQLFGIELSFDVDLSQLSQTYQTLQKAVHPDKFAHASAQEQLLAVQKSAQINDGYQTLKQPLERAKYLLTLRGVVLPDEQQSFSDNSFLMRQMELRERLAEIRFSDDIDSALADAQKVLTQEYQVHFEQMRAQINANNADENAKASENLRKLTFYHKLNIEVERLEESLFDD